MTPFETNIGYIPGLIGRVAELHATYYAEHWGFGLFFEAKVATELAAFVSRYDDAVDRIWSLGAGGRIEGAIAIDGSSESGQRAHLRWFIVSDRLRAQGAGNHLMALAMSFCRQAGFEGVYLWTFEGLYAALHLYEKFGFRLVEAREGLQWGTSVTEQRFELRLTPPRRSSGLR